MVAHGATKAQHGLLEVYHGALEAHDGALEAHYSALEAHHSAVKAHHGTMEAHHGGNYHSFTVEDSAITTDYIDSCAATMNLPRCLKMTKRCEEICII